MKTFKEFFSKLHIPLWLFVVLLVVLILRVPSFFEPYYYGDEMIYLTLGQGIRKGITLYKNLHDNKPPLLYLMAAVAGNLFWFKAILAVWMTATTIFFWKLINNLFPKSELLIKVSTIFFAILTTLPLFEGNIANAELFMIGFTILALNIILFAKDTYKNKFIAGILFSLGALFKIPAAFDLMIVVSFYFIYLKLTIKDIKKTFLNLVFLSIGFLLPIVLTFAYYFLKGAFQEYLIAAFLQNFGYLSTWKEGPKLSFWDKNAALLIRFGVVLVGNLLLLTFKKKLKKEYVILVLWILWGSFAVSLSERPYPHYFVQVLAPVSILLGLFFTDKTNLQTLSLIPLLIAFAVPYYYKFWYYPTSTYYERFINLVTKKITSEEYIASFDNKSKRNYDLAKLITSTTTSNDRVFIWGNSATVYALSRRLPPIKYTIEYHINDFSSHTETLKGIMSTKPKEIVILKDATPFPELESYALQNYLNIYEDGDVTVYKAVNETSLVYLK